MPCMECVFVLMFRYHDNNYMYYLAHLVGVAALFDLFVSPVASPVDRL